MASLKSNSLTFPDTNCGIKVINGQTQTSISFTLSKESWCSAIAIANISGYGNSIFAINLRNNEVLLTPLIPNSIDVINTSVSNGVITLSLSGTYGWSRILLLYN